MFLLRPFSISPCPFPCKGKLVTQKEPRRITSQCLRIRIVTRIRMEHLYRSLQMKITSSHFQQDFHMSPHVLSRLLHIILDIATKRRIPRDNIIISRVRNTLRLLRDKILTFIRTPRRIVMVFPCIIIRRTIPSTTRG